MKTKKYFPPSQEGNFAFHNIKQATFALLCVLLLLSLPRGVVHTCARLVDDPFISPIEKRARFIQFILYLFK